MFKEISWSVHLSQLVAGWVTEDHPYAMEDGVV